MKRADLRGKTFGRLTALEFTRIVSSSGRNRSGWKCSCKCGGVVVVECENLKSGRTISCGCYKLDNPSHYTHGEASKHSKSKEYRAWCGMKTRCYDKSNKNYPYWGGRGIRVDKRWRNSYENFLLDMGRSPVNTSLDRIDNNGNYAPGNCRWATATQQSRNRRSRKR